MKSIHFGIVGTGQMASTMLEAFKHLPNVKVIAVCGSSQVRTKQFASTFAIPNVYFQLEDFLNNQEVDAVYIANATENHAKTTIAALKMGKSVLCEKPIAVSETESLLIEQEAKLSGKLCMEVMWTHCLPAYQAFFNQSQFFGQPSQLYADFGYPVNADNYPRLFTPSKGSGVLLDRAVYPIALAVKLFGKVKSVHSNIIYNQECIDIHADMLLKHENGCQSSLVVSLQVLMQNRAVLSFSNGSASLEPPLLGTETLRIQYFHPQTEPNIAEGTFKSRLKKAMKQSTLLRFFKSKKQQGKSHYLPYGANQYLPVLTHFCELLREDKLQSDLIPLKLSTEVLRVIDQIKTSQNQKH